MADTRKSKMITNKKDIDDLISLTENDITLSYIMEMFGEFEGVRKYNPYDLVKIPPNSYGKGKKKNKNTFITTVGCFIFNKYFIEDDLFDIFGYINKSIDDGVFSDINKKLSYCLVEGKITQRQLTRYLDKTQKCMPYSNILCPGYTEKMLTCTKVINVKKKELLDKYKKEIEAGDELVGDKLEKELLSFALDYMKDDPSMDIFLSGARGSIGNNFKNIFVMKGLIRDPDPNAIQKYKLASSNYIDGISAEEYVLFANSLSAGPFARSRKTATGGYLEKLFISAFQNVILDPEGSDCGTKRTKKVYLDKKNIQFYMYSYIVSGDKLIEITSDNMDKYIGKTVNMRFSDLCESKTGICNKCMGNLLYKLDIINAGVSVAKIPSTLKNIAMKAFHDSTEKLREIPLDKVF